MNEQSRYKQDKTITRQSINVKRHIFNLIGGTEEFEERDLNIGGDFSALEDPHFVASLLDTEDCFEEVECFLYPGLALGFVPWGTLSALEEGLGDLNTTSVSATQIANMWQQPVGMKPPAFATHHLAAATVAAANCLARMSGLKKVRGGLLPVEQPPCSLWSSQRRGTTSLRQWPLVTRRVGGHGRAWSGSQYKHLTRMP
ncbi:hypothetical protein Tco_1235471 [Tanacetum coccineum]